MKIASPQLKLYPHLEPMHALVSAAVEDMATAGREARGAVFTRQSVVAFILDLAGYTSDKPLHKQRLLEPSFGEGDFLLPAVERLLTSWQQAIGKPSHTAGDLADSIRAIELHRMTFTRTQRKLLDLLLSYGIAPTDANTLIAHWLIQADFLLKDLPGDFDIVIGNPPYVRQERVADVLIEAYRARYGTLYDRADLYVPFIERSLSLLRTGGNLAFICADRWMKNRYGGPLRRMVAEGFHLKVYVDMVDTPAFHTHVSAYPAITVIAREPAGVTRIAHRPEVTGTTLMTLAKALTAKSLRASPRVLEIPDVTNGAEPWILESSDQLAIVRRLEKEFPTLEAAGCKVGIGVATGADKAFIGPFATLDVEADRKLPLVTSRDIVTGTVKWHGLGVIDPFEVNGRLVDLKRYPRLEHYFEERKEHIASRHCARKAPANWYRTIDRIYPNLTTTPKLLIPDIKGKAHIVYEGGEFYPHHSLYYITSDEWDLKALQAVLLSGIAQLFVATYTTRMRGGYLRFQAQYLRRIRLPHWQHIPDTIKQELIATAERNDTPAWNKAVFHLYGLSKEEREALGGNGE